MDSIDIFCDMNAYECFLLVFFIMMTCEARPEKRWMNPAANLHAAGSLFQQSQTQSRMDGKVL